ncbi:uncharacterized protein Z518_01209 [Rhinocladiella mackenziei CBS 650.93]|uniref:Rhinocladiella mackenziei CBS 650.93 unplaced genomic scaffold supercont1.1, whole genome shotgun sequence n=1 Tax=Rhinocladiella mackenziei CBS 650.93 TaxID=1442369 RepID=A0A0D2HHJ2_9EURO|nr:uncharacterized protein Z518_01209 [Rhinocladiella mackenziei CBS 650.93]KIX10128.1 hypothetical protein Z518_01209 [Rhinocladiella mackenziei CBS 650.93]
MNLGLNHIKQEYAARPSAEKKRKQQALMDEADRRQREEKQKERQGSEAEREMQQKLGLAAQVFRQHSRRGGETSTALLRLDSSKMAQWCHREYIQSFFPWGIKAELSIQTVATAMIDGIILSIAEINVYSITCILR